MCKREKQNGKKKGGGERGRCIGNGVGGWVQFYLFKLSFSLLMRHGVARLSEHKHKVKNKSVVSPHVLYFSTPLFSFVLFLFKGMLIWDKTIEHGLSSYLLLPNELELHFFFKIKYTWPSEHSTSSKLPLQYLRKKIKDKLNEKTK